MAVFRCVLCHLCVLIRILILFSSYNFFKVLAESVEELVEVVAKNLNQNEWSFDNDPDGKLKKEVMSIIENY